MSLYHIKICIRTVPYTVQHNTYKLCFEMDGIR
jgi:hypothetical protein